jgi:hypothetical protein
MKERFPVLKKEALPVTDPSPSIRAKVAFTTWAKRGSSTPTSSL